MKNICWDTLASALTLIQGSILDPVSESFVMTATEPVEAAIKIQPELAISMHYGSLVGDEGDVDVFKRELEGNY